jgi:hypothetical protein
MNQSKNDFIPLLNSKRNEIIAWCSHNIWSCFLLGSHHCHMFFYHQCSLHHICVNQVSNDNVHQGLEVDYGDKDIHSLLGVMRKKVGDLLLNMCSILEINSYNNMLKCIMGYCTFIPTRAPTMCLWDWS